ncbi:MAG: hypothetical protein HY243_17555 [Proteobacteria bacterium]|nr:hypothetical protein [Pseudomonadota bacterium]
MNSRRLGLAAAFALLPTTLVSGAALAGAATFSANYANLDFYGAGFNANSWGGAGAGTLDLGSSWKVEGDAAYDHLTTSGVSFNHWNVSASAFWQGDMGRAGLQLGYNSGDGAGLNLHGLNYGVVGEWWANSNITLAAKGGGLNGSSGIDGYYLGLQGKAYLGANFALSTSADFTSFKFGHETDLTVQGEWLVSQTTPISVYAGYSNSDFPSGGPGDVNVWFVGLRLYCNDPGGTSLVDRQRSGTLGWAGAISPVALRF